MQPYRSNVRPPSTRLVTVAFCGALAVTPDARADPTPASTITTALPAAPGPKAAQGVVPLALPTYSPETRWALGAALIYYRRSDGERAPATSVKVGVVGTEQRQFSVSTVADQYLWDRAARLSFVGSARRFPDMFWELGPNSRDSSREKYRRDELTADVGLLFCLRQELRVGPAVRLERFRIAEAEPGRILSSGGVEGASGTTAATVGPHLEWDTRDSIYFPHQGWLAIARAGLGHSSSGGHGALLGRLDLDARRFVHLHGEHVLALQAVAQIRGGSTPFELMPILGGDILLRGYYQGRYRDQNLLALQTEYRFPLWWRLGAVIFGGAGEVASSIRLLASSPLRFAGGGGLRVTLDKDEHINLRVDLATNQRGEGSGYLSISEAF